MTVQLIRCDAQRPDRRAIATTLQDIGSGVDDGLARELTDILLDGSPVEIEVDQNPSSAFRALRKLDIEYELDD